VPAVRDLFLDAGATGYTAVSGVSGFGHHGHHQGRLLFNDRASLSMLITVVPIERADGLIAGIRRLLDDHHGCPVRERDTRESARLLQLTACETERRAPSSSTPTLSIRSSTRSSPVGGGLRTTPGDHPEPVAASTEDRRVAAARAGRRDHRLGGTRRSLEVAVDRGDHERASGTNSTSTASCWTLTHGKSVYLEEYARGEIGQEELHVIEMNELLREYSIS
jgi:hypothetical protein